MKKLTEEFSGDYRVLRLLASSSDPMETLYNLHHKYTYRMFVDMLEYLDAKDTLEEDARKKQELKFQQSQQKQKR